MCLLFRRDKRTDRERAVAANKHPIFSLGRNSQNARLDVPTDIPTATLVGGYTAPRDGLLALKEIHIYGDLERGHAHAIIYIDGVRVGAWHVGEVKQAYAQCVGAPGGLFAIRKGQTLRVEIATFSAWGGIGNVVSGGTFYPFR